MNYQSIKKEKKVFSLLIFCHGIGRSNSVCGDVATVYLYVRELWKGLLGDLKLSSLHGFWTEFGEFGYKVTRFRVLISKL